MRRPYTSNSHASAKTSSTWSIQMPMTVRLTSMTHKPVEALVCVWLNSRQSKKPNVPWTVKNLQARTFEEIVHGEIPTFGKLFPRVWKDRGRGEGLTRALREVVDLVGRSYSLEADKCGGAKDLEGTAAIQPLESMFYAMMVDAFFELASGDWPIAEFIQFNFSFANCPAMFVYHLDRQRDAAFWEMSGRVRGYEDLADSGDYFIASDIADKPLALALTQEIFQREQDTYKELLKLGVRKESARGHVGVHAHSTADMSINLRVLRAELKKRTCYFAQSDYWGPAIQGMIDELLRGECSEMPDDPRTAALFGLLPCDGGHCNVKFDALERLENKDRPICPVLYSKFLSTEEKAEVDPIMVLKYGHEGFTKHAHEYFSTLRRPTAAFDVSIEHLRAPKRQD